MRRDATEAMANAAIGFLVSWAATWMLLGFSPVESIAITGLFFCLSFTRAFIIRRIFRRLYA